MLVIKVELHPQGRGGAHVRELGRLVIANVGGTDEHGDYVVKLGALPPAAAKDERWFDAVWSRPARTGHVTGHARLTEPVWSLVAKALHAVGFGS